MQNQMHNYKTCGVFRRNGSHSFVSCPDPKRVKSYLRDTVVFSESISNDDQICYPCYKYFNQML
jgi:hypothetical protein